MKGFTLIETLIYIALFSTIIFSGLVTAFNLIQGSDVLNKKTVTQEEGNFVIRKIDWALTGATNITTGGSLCSQTLGVDKFGFGHIDFHITAGTSSKIEINEGTGFLPITTDNASTTCLQFIATSSTMYGVTASTTINKISFSITKYVRH